MRKCTIRKVRHFPDDMALWEVQCIADADEGELLEAYYNATHDGGPLWVADGGGFEAWGAALEAVEGAARWEAANPDWAAKAARLLAHADNYNEED